MCILNLSYPDISYSYPVEPTKEDYNEYLTQGGKPISFNSEDLEKSTDFYDFMVQKYKKEAYLMYARDQDMLVTSLFESEFYRNEN